MKNLESKTSPGKSISNRSKPSFLFAIQKTTEHKSQQAGIDEE